jgi:hypothetical protein
MTERLADRYRRLLHLYPKEYLKVRGDEMLSTYMDSVPPGRTRPTVADAADVLRGAGRRWLRTTRTGDLPAGLRTAGVLSLAAAAGLAAFWLLRVESAPLPDNYLLHSRWGIFQSASGVAWSLWMLAALTAALLPRAHRAVVVTALIATVAAVPVSTMLSLNTPPMSIVVSQFALGLMALAFPPTPTLLERLLPLLATATVTFTAVAATAWRQPTAYRYTEAPDTPISVLELAALALAAAAAVWAITDLAAKRRARGLWAAVLLLGPLLITAFRQLEPSSTAPAAPGAGAAYWLGLAGTAGLLAAAALAALLAAVVWRDRTRTE